MTLLALLPSMPAAVDVDAPAPEFSSARALKHLRWIASEPHPTGSEAQARVVTRIESTLAGLGLHTEIQEGKSASMVHGTLTLVSLRNVIAYLPGESRRGTILVCAHSDSVAEGPGAGDDGAAVASILETVRAIQAGPALRNSIMILITDGEELGLRGARMFMENHPLASDVEVVINFEARGNAGPSLMFETGEHSDGLVKHFISLPYTVCSSLMAAVYAKMPNGTDFTVFRRAGIEGLNFAFIGGHDAYHAPTDTIENLSERSLQHHGVHMLNVLRLLGDLDLAESYTPEKSVYFNLLGSWVILYPMNWVWPLATLALTLLGLALHLGRRRGLLRGRFVALSFALHGLVLLVVTALSAGLCHFALWSLDGYLWKPWGRTSSDEVFFAAITLITVSIVCSCHAWMSRRLGAENVNSSALLWWAGALVASCVAIPEGSFLFQWPLALAASARLVAISGRADPETTSTPVLLMLLPGLLITTPIIHLFYQAMTLGLAPVGIPLVALSTALVTQDTVPTNASLFTTAGILATSNPSTSAARGNALTHWSIFAATSMMASDFDEASRSQPGCAMPRGAQGCASRPRPRFIGKR